MYAVRASEELPGRPVARLPSGHPAMDRDPVLDDGSAWVDDLDLSIDAAERHAPRPRRGSPLLVALVGVAFVMMVGLGVLGAMVIGGAAAAVAFLMMAPRT